jgi:flagella basal body P-ring formation protein FlgA
MTRVLALLVLLLGLLRAGLADAAEPEARLALAPIPPMLKAQAVVEGELITLGDLFDHLDPAKAKQAVAYAPQPGKRVTYDANWLYGVARAQSVAWRPMTAYERIVVDRPGQPIAREDIDSVLLSALAFHGIEGNAAVELTNRTMQIHVPMDAKPIVAVRDLTYDPRARRFTATLEAPANAAGAQRHKVSGRVFQVVEVPVLARNIGKDDRINAKDVKWMPMSVEQVREDMITDADQLIGKHPRRLIRAGQPMTQNDVQRPVLVPRHSMVTMIVQQGTMTITAQGKAIEEGGAGETIRVLNTHTNATVEATVNGAGLVTVRPTRRELVH